MALTVFGCSGVVGQQAAPPGGDLSAYAARRFPQPVRVGDLLGRTVLAPLESRPVLGHVASVIRLNGGNLAIVVTYGGWFGFGGRPIAVPVEAMVLLGDELEILDFTPEQLRALPSYEQHDAMTLAKNDVIKLGLAHPSH